MFPEHAAVDSSGVWRPERNDGREVSFSQEASDRSFLVEEDSFWFAHRNKVIETAFRRFPPPTATIVDVGGGNGVVTAHLQNAGIECTVVEPIYSACCNARRRGVERVFCGSFADLQVPDDSMPAVGLFDVLEHLDHPESLLGEVRAALTKGGERPGRIYITVPAHEWLWSNYDVRAGHFRRYTIDSIQELAQRCGLRIDYVSYFFSYFSVPIFSFRALPFRLGLNRSLEASEEKKSRDTQRQHDKGDGVLSRILGSFLAKELQVLKASRLTHGASIIAVCSPCSESPPAQTARQDP